MAALIKDNYHNCKYYIEPEGEKIEELTESLKTSHEESEREIRILKHRLNIVQGTLAIYLQLSSYLYYLSLFGVGTQTGYAQPVLNNYTIGQGLG